MKNKKTLSILLIIFSSLLVVTVAVTAILWPTLWKKKELTSVPPTVVIGTDADKNNGFADVTAYGAVANDGIDDTEAFLQAVKTGAGVYVPIGKFDINKTVVLKGQNLKGAGIDRSVINFNGNGTIVEMKDAAMVDDITLGFGKDFITGKEKKGEQVAIKDKGIKSGAMIRAVKLINVGTGYSSSVTADAGLSFSVESLLVDKFSYKAIEVKDAFATVFRTVKIGTSSGKADSAVKLSGSFTLDAIVFDGTECNYSLELDNCDSATVNSVVFNNCKVSSGSLIKSISSTVAVKTATVKNTETGNLFEICDNSENGETVGNVVSLWTDNSALKTDENGKIKCNGIISQ